jgi:hypothetical protein
MKNIDIRIKRPRTAIETSIWELLEQWAAMEGRTLPGAVERLIETNPIFKEFAQKQRQTRWGQVLGADEATT